MHALVRARSSSLSGTENEVCAVQFGDGMHQLVVIVVVTYEAVFMLIGHRTQTSCHSYPTQLVASNHVVCPVPSSRMLEYYGSFKDKSTGCNGASHPSFSSFQMMNCDDVQSHVSYTLKLRPPVMKSTHAGR